MPGASDTAADTRLDLTDALVQLSFVIQEALRSVAAEFGLSMTQVRLIGILRDREPGILELARHLGLEKSSVSGLVDRAVRRGLVERVASAYDARSSQVRLTRAGRDTARRFASRLDPQLDQLTERLGARERAQLIRLAGKIV